MKERESKDKDDGNKDSWLTSIAIFGDSGVSLVISLLILLLAALFSWRVDSLALATEPTSNAGTGSNSNWGGSIPMAFGTEESLGPLPWIETTPHIHTVTDSHRFSSDSASALRSIRITNDMRAEYERDGVICIRGLIAPELLDRLDMETKPLVDAKQAKRENTSNRRRGTQFHTVEHWALFRETKTSNVNATSAETGNSTNTPTALMQAALWSAIPAVAAQLLNVTGFGLDDETATTTTETLRVIRDIFLAKDDDAYVCGWHVDDMGFWPATPESIGINAWIALDDMDDTSITGGLALAVQSHTAVWRDAAYYSTGASMHFPLPDGYHNASHMLGHRTGQGTCNLQRVAPHIHRRMEATKRVYPVKRGDVIFHTRWLFHRTVAMTQPDPTKVYRRYSIRYGLGSTVIPPGYGTEYSVLWDETNGGRTADSVHENDGPWYPQAWPPLPLEQTDDATEKPPFWPAWHRLIRDKLPVAEERREARIREMKPLLQFWLKNNTPKF